MEQVFTAVTISVFIMMGSALFVLIWEMLDKQPKHLINLEEEVYQEVIIFLGSDDKNNIARLINDAVLNYMRKE